MLSSEFLNVELFALLVVVHLVADWIFQSQPTALKKTTNKVVRFNHCLIYATISVLLLLILPAGLRVIDVGFIWCLLFMSHLLIDDRRIVKWLLIQKKMSEQDIRDNVWLVIMLDQILHLIVLLIIALII